MMNLQEKIDLQRKIKELNSKLRTHRLEVFEWEDKGLREQHDSIAQKLQREIRKLTKLLAGE